MNGVILDISLIHYYDALKYHELLNIGLVYYLL